MTNAELIATIRNEIERRKGQAKEHYNEPYSIGRCDAFSEMLNFIDSLEEKSEKPMQGLEEEIVKVCDDFAFPLYGLDDEFGRELINKIARHFAQWGYLRAAEKYDEIEYNRQRAEEDTPKDLEEAAWDCVLDSVDVNNTVLLPKYKVLLTSLFIDGAKWQEEQDEKEQADLFTIVALDAAQRTKEQMMKDIPKWHKVQRGSCFDKHTNFLLSAREGHFYCSSIEVPRDGYILLVDELERLPKEDEK